MKNNVLKYYIAAFYLCSTFVAFAQGPGEGNGGTDDGALEGGDPPAPIDDYVWLLAVVGLAFVFLKFRAMYKQRIS
jgi:hypothetical protein